MVPDLKSTNPTDVVAHLCSLLHRQGRLNNSAAFYDAVVRREHVCPTSIAPGWAVPHGRLQGLTQLSFAFARTSHPLIWFGGGSIHPQIIFLFAIPEAEAITYLSLVAAVAKLNQNPALLQQLHSAPDADSMFTILEQIPVHLRRPTVAVATQAG